MGIAAKHIVSVILALIVFAGSVFGAFKYGEYIGDKNSTEELNRFKNILSKTEETKYLNGEWWFYEDSGGFHRRSEKHYNSLEECKQAFSDFTIGELQGVTGGCAKNCILNMGANYNLSLSKCEEYEPL